MTISARRRPISVERAERLLRVHEIELNDLRRDMRRTAGPKYERQRVQLRCLVGTIIPRDQRVLEEARTVK